MEINEEGTRRSKYGMRQGVRNKRRDYEERRRGRRRRKEKKKMTPRKGREKKY